MQEFKFIYLRFKNKIITELEYKTNLFMGILLQVTFYIMMFIFLKIIFKYTPQIANLSFADALIYVFVFDLITDIPYLFRINLDYEIISGTLNNALTKPINELIYLLFFQFSKIVMFFLNFIMIIVVNFYYHIHITLLNFVIFIFLVFISLPLIFFPQLTIKSLVFWFNNVDSILRLYQSTIYSFQKFPVTILDKIIQIFFIALSPAIYFSIYFPIMVLLGKTNIYNIFLAIIWILLLDILVFIIFYLVYKKGLKQYEGFG